MSFSSDGFLSFYRMRKNFLGCSSGSVGISRKRNVRVERVILAFPSHTNITTAAAPKHVKVLRRLHKSLAQTLPKSCPDFGKAWDSKRPCARSPKGGTSFSIILTPSVDALATASPPRALNDWICAELSVFEMRLRRINRPNAVIITVHGRPKVSLRSAKRRSSRESINARSLF